MAIETLDANAANDPKQSATVLGFSFGRGKSPPAAVRIANAHPNEQTISGTGVVTTMADRKSRRDKFSTMPL